MIEKVSEVSPTGCACDEGWFNYVQLHPFEIKFNRRGFNREEKKWYYSVLISCFRKDSNSRRAEKQTSPPSLSFIRLGSDVFWRHSTNPIRDLREWDSNIRYG
ncbi:hypothetical protein MKW98_025412 [Papaver atlanticum]|uniref:Uncharacterized protein n=1 Tax=Papaver atlanticum TaxID=357466 RepID=A0AAD4XD15_9MAGN|nr:hypothetical protein MKW98_025412 [Papaver atlanticum]